MDEVRIRARFDWLVEISGAMAPGLAAGFAAFKLAPSFAIAPAAAMAAAGLAAFALGLIGMRTVKPGACEFRLAGVSIGPIDLGERPLDGVAAEPLLLDVRYVEASMLESDVVADGALLLDDPLVADPNSRVVQLFASPSPPTPGQLKDRIDRHLAGEFQCATSVIPTPRPDASDALYAALAELRRSLR